MRSIDGFVGTNEQEELNRKRSVEDFIVKNPKQVFDRVERAKRELERFHETDPVLTAGNHHRLDYAYRMLEEAFEPDKRGQGGEEI